MYYEGASPTTRSLVVSHARRLAWFFGLRVALTSVGLALAKVLVKRWA